MFELTIDTGGTFTDGLLIDEKRKISVAKFPTNVANPPVSIMGCITLLAQERGLTKQELLADTTTLVMGTTFATNCVLEEKGAKCCLIYTKGFKDIPELLRRIPKPDIYNAMLPAPNVLIPRYLRFGIEERIQFDGEIITPLNENDVHEAARKAKEENVEVPVVCFLNSYINSVHEERAAEILKTQYSDVVVSSHVLRRWIEWDRLTTAVLAGYVKPALGRLLATLEEHLKKANFKGTLLFITCAGGVATPDLCVDNPALLIGSGPAAGPLLGRFLGELNGFENVIVCDMGGTSFDVSLLPGRMILTTRETAIGDYRSGCEAVDVTTLGAGGGSIAWIDELGMLRVGPSSAGADPGPACYGTGGQKPTVTDADVILGYIPADYFLGGRMPLNRSLAEKVVEENIARPLSIDVVEAAHAISSIVEANMAERVFLSAVKKGFDPREFRLIVGGGAGAVHGIAIASRLGIKQLYIPKLAALFCALGIALADYKYVLSRVLYRKEDEVNVNELKDLYHSLEEEGVATLARQGVTGEEMRFMRGAEMRYSGQLHDIEVLLPEIRRGESFTEENFKALIQGFHERHKAIYGYSDPAMQSTIATLKLQAIGMRRPVELIKQAFSDKDPSAALKRKRMVYFKELGGLVETPCYDAERLRHGNVIMGPAVIEHPQTTLVMSQGAELTVDAYENYEIVRLNQ
jgi:N-methylhydantoinase A